MPTPTKYKVVQQPIKNIIPEIDVTQQKQQQQQEKEEILCAGKRSESYKKELLIPLREKQKKIIRC